MNVLFTVEATAQGSRERTVTSPDGRFHIQLGNPLAPAGESDGPGPELLFAAAYAASYFDALSQAAQTLGTPSELMQVRALVSLMEDPARGHLLDIELHARLPAADRTMTQHLMAEAHLSCPYSKAMRGDFTVALVAD